MFPKLAVIVTATLAAFATAVPTGHGGSCNASNQYCCKSVTQSNAGNMPALLGRLGINVGAIPVGIGLNCVSATVLGGLTGSSCTQQPTCCTGNTYESLITVACNPISV